MREQKALYGFSDSEHAILCVIKDISFRGMDIIITAVCDGGTITAPIEMFKIIE